MRLSPHANIHLLPMQVTLEEIEAAFSDPEVVHPCDARKYGPGRQMRKRGRLSLVCGADDVVITVLWSGESTGYQPWDRTNGPVAPSSGRHGHAPSRPPRTPR
jgi:hypothetical protein